VFLTLFPESFSYFSTSLNLPEFNLPTLRSLQGTKQKNLPSIYLFLVESLRRDFLDPEITPHLYALSKNSVNVPAYANSNSSLFSLYAILNSKYSFRYYYGENHLGPSLPIQQLKELGYQTSFVTSGDVRGMDKVIFGENRELLDFYLDEKKLSGTVVERDASLFKQMTDWMGSDHSPRFICFYPQSSHWEYHWPKSYPTKFTPLVEKFNYMRLDYKEDYLLGVKNRLKNSLHYVDSLFGSFIETLKKQNRFDSSLIIVTGDHGEEFMEHGTLAHGAELCDIQLGIPLYFKTPYSKRMPIAENKIASHIDLMPSIWSLLEPNQSFSWMEGDSVWSTNQKMPLSQNAHHPQRFCVSHGKYRLQFNMVLTSLNPRKVEIQVTGITDSDQNFVPFPVGAQEIEPFLSEEFGFPQMLSIFGLEGQVVDYSNWKRYRKSKP